MRLTHVLAASAALGILAGCKREPAPSPPVPNPGDAGVFSAGRGPKPEVAPSSSPLTVMAVPSASAAASATAVVPSIGIGSHKQGDRNNCGAVPRPPVPRASSPPDASR